MNEVLLTDRDGHRSPEELGIDLRRDQIVELVTTCQNDSSTSNQIASWIDRVTLVGQELSEISSQISLEASRPGPDSLGQLMLSNEGQDGLSSREDGEGHNFGKLNVSGRASTRSLRRPKVFQPSRLRSREGRLIGASVADRSEDLRHSRDQLLSIQTRRHRQSESVSKVDQGLSADRRRGDHDRRREVQAVFRELKPSIGSRNRDGLRPWSGDLCGRDGHSGQLFTSGGRIRDEVVDRGLEDLSIPFLSSLWLSNRSIIDRKN